MRRISADGRDSTHTHPRGRGCHTLLALSPHGQTKAPFVRIAATAATQDELVTRPQLLKLGLSDDQIGWMTKHRILQTLHAGVYLHGCEPPTWRQGMRAAMFAGGPATFASHRGGAAVYGVMEPSVVEVTVPIMNDLELRGGVVHRTRRPLTKTRVMDGIRVCSLERVLFDLASVCTEEEVECAVEAALRKRLTTEERLWTALVVEGGPGIAGTAVFRRVLENRPEGRPARSVLEVLTGRLLRRRGIRDFVRNHPVEVNGDNFEIDFAFLRLRIALEVDGRAFHSTRTQKKADIDRQRKLEDAGWLFIRVGWRDVLLRPDWVIEQLRSAFAERCASNLG